MNAHQSRWPAANGRAPGKAPSRRRWAVLATPVLLAGVVIPVGQSAAMSGGLAGFDSEAPWAVRIDIPNSGCSGALVAPDVVLTASHCTSGRTATQLKVYVPGSRTLHLVGSIRENPDGYDAALLNLSASTSGVKTLPLSPTSTTVSGFANRGVGIYAWGRTQPDGPMSTVLRKAPDGAFVMRTPCTHAWLAPEGGRACFENLRLSEGVAVRTGDSGAAWVGWVDGNWVQLAILKGQPRGTLQVGGPSVAAPVLRKWILANTGGRILNPAVGSIVRDSTSGGAWRIDSTGFRRWIPDGRTYNCLIGQGVQVSNHAAARIATVPDRNGVHQSCTRSQLSSGHTLYRGDYLRSPDGRYKLHLQASDGNLVLYNAANAPIWRTGRLGGARLVMQGDSNLVVYDAASRPLWASNTVGRGANRFVVQSDGNMVIYTAGGNPVWASNTVGR